MPEPTAAVASFAEVTALTYAGPGRFDAVLNPDWTIVGKPNGGYILAMLGRAAALSSPEHPDPVAASAHYLRSPDPGPVTVEAEVLREGRSASQVRARLTQAGQPCVEALVTTSRLDGASPRWTHGLPTRPPSDYEACTRLVPRLPDGSRVRILDQVELRLDPEVQGFTLGQPRGRGELHGWLTLPRGDAFDPVSLLFAVDALPPATMDIALTGWVPTLELTAYLRARPAPGPVHVFQRAQLIAGQRVDQACFVWDAAGALVAQATQLAAIRLD